MNLIDTPALKFEIRSGSRVLSEGYTTRVAADLAFERLSEEDKANAVIVPVTAGGNQYLAG